MTNNIILLYGWERENIERGEREKIAIANMEEGGSGQSVSQSTMYNFVCSMCDARLDMEMSLYYLYTQYN